VFVGYFSLDTTWVLGISGFAHKGDHIAVQPRLERVVT
jgi:hypothetical protein